MIPRPRNSLTVWLGRLGFLLAHRAHHGDERNVNKGHIFAANTELELPERLDVRCRFNVADRTAKFDNAGVGRAVTAVSGAGSYIFDPILDGVGDM